MALGKLTAILELDDAGFRAKFERNGKLVSDFSKDLSSLNPKIQATSKSFTTLGHGIRDFTITMSLASGAIHNLHQITTGWMVGILNTAGELERMTKLMTGLSDATTQLGKALEGQSSMKFITDLAQKAPFAINNLNDSFVKLKAGGLDPLDGSMQSLVDAVAHFGGTGDIMHRAAIAIQQMGSKGVVSMEELRQQLGEAVPDAIRLMARGMGISIQELVDKVSKGMVRAGPAMKLMMDEWKIEFSGSAQSMMETWTGMIEQLKTKWILFQNDIAKGGFADAGKQSLQELMKVLDSPELKLAASKLGAALSSVAKSIGEIISWVRGNYTIVEQFVKVVLSLAGIAAANVALKAVLGTLTAIGGILPGMFGNLSKVISGFGEMTTRVKGSGSALSAVGIVIGTLVRGPIGGLITALGIATTAWNAFRGSTSSAFAELQRANQSGIYMGPAKYLDNYQNISKLVGDAEGKRRAVDDAQFKVDHPTYLNSIGKGKEESLKALAEAKEAHRQSLDEVKKYRQELSKQESAAGQDIAGKESQKFQDDIEKARSAQLQVIAREREQIQTDLEKAKVGSEEYKKLQASLETSKQRFKGIDVAHNEKAAAEAQKIAASEMAKGNFDLAKAFADRANEFQHQAFQQKEMNRQMSETSLYMEGKGKKAAGKKTGKSDVEKAVDAADNHLDRLRVTNAQLKAQYSELLQNLDGKNSAAKENALIGLGEVKGIAPGSKNAEAANSLVADIDRQRQAIVDLTAAKSAQERVDQLITNTTADLDQQLEAVSSKLSNPYGVQTYTSGLQKINASFEKMRASLKEQIELHSSDANAVNILTQAMENLNQAQSKAQANVGTIDSGNYITEYRDKTEELRRSMLTLEEARQEDYQKEIFVARAALDKILTNEKANLAERTTAQQAYSDYINMLNKKRAEDAENPIMSLTRQWEDGTKQMKLASQEWLREGADAFVQFAMTGKLQVKSLVTSILQQIARIAGQKAIGSIINGIVGIATSVIGGAVGGGDLTGAAGDAIATNSGQAVAGSTFQGASLFAKGGIMTEFGSLPLHKYAGGGVARTPQMSMFGEGRMPEAYVPLPDGRSIPVSMKGGGGGDSVIININVNNDGSESSNNSGGQKTQKDWNRLADKIKTVVRQEIGAQKRDGGLLYQ